jgi:hypothetical protein
LSRRLGEDPLTRARKKRATATKTALTSTSGTAGETRAAEATPAPPRSSFNDVFFERKSTQEGGAATIETDSLSEAADGAHRQPSPEISEISEIPEIRELATATGSTSTVVDISPQLAITEVAGPSIPVADSTHRTDEHQDAARVHDVDETTTAHHHEAEPAPALTSQLETHGEATDSVTPVEAKPQEASAITSTVAPPSDEPEKAQPAPRKGGLFKKIFGRFGGR